MGGSARHRSAPATACRPRGGGCAWFSRSTRSNAARYQVTDRSCDSARLVCASITERGVRSSWDASAVKSSWRWRARSMGAATRRPMPTAPRKTSASRIGPITDSARMRVDCAWETLSMVCPTTTYCAPAGAPAMRTSVLLIEMVCGAVTCRSAAGSTAPAVLLVTVPSAWTVHTMTGAPNGRSGGGAPKPPAGGGGSWAIRDRDAVSRASSCEVRSRLTIRTTAIATSR